VRIGMVKQGERQVPATERGGQWYEIKGVTDVLSLIVEGVELDELEVAEEALGRVRILAPLRPRKIVAIGLNYLDHCREAAMDPPSRPLVFAKFPSSVISAEAQVVIDPELSERVDWEVELAVVIGKILRRASVRDALSSVFGYTVANDISARDVQFSDGQWVRGKSFDTFCPLGPVIVSADEIPEPQDLALRTRVNGETVQDSNTSQMVFGVAELLSFCSYSFSLEPGDVVLTGTPWGCGEFMTPRRSLSDGDVVECEISGVGVLSNPVCRVAV